MKFASRTGELSPREGLDLAYRLFAEGRLLEAAMMFLAYEDQESDVGVVSETEFNKLAAHFKEMLAYVTIYKMIMDRQLQPALSDDGDKPAYKHSPWFDENYSLS